jgi:diguanylate cyclase (GGDEF)-like protein
LLAQDRVLSGDLEDAALRRLEGAAQSTSLLVDGHLDSLRERYQAISGTPQFRATLEVQDLPTLNFLARQLAAREGADLIAFVGREGGVKAMAGDESLLNYALDAEDPGLIASGERAFAVARIELETAGLTVGRLVAVEAIRDEMVARWSDLCGAKVEFAALGVAQQAAVRRSVRDLGELVLGVSMSTHLERSALQNSRFNLLTAGVVAMALALVLSVFVSRGLVGPILEIQNATVRVAEGDFDTRLRSVRHDELGDVARSVDLMLDRLSAYRGQVDDQRLELEDNISQLQDSQSELANAQRLAQIGSWRVNLESGELRGSREFRAIFGLEQEDKPIDPQYLLDCVHPEDRSGLEDAVLTCMTEGATLRMDCRVKLHTVSERILHIQSRNTSNSEGRVIRVEGTVQDVTARIRSEEQIRYLAYHDSLTGLGNRLLCRDRLDIQISTARRSDEMLGLLIIDLDRFKRINDTLGHTIGDELLKDVADQIVASVRGTDYVGRTDIEASVARLGGDEFTVIIPHLSDVQDLALVARRILRSLSEPFELGGHSVVISGSIGIAAFPFDGEDVETLLRNADAAMYHAKSQGRNNYQFYTESMNAIAMRRLILESKMRGALERDEFELHYQPKVSLDSGRVTGAEALIRWRDPEAGLVSPADFIPIAEETGLITPIGEWVIRKACEQIAIWNDEGCAVPISVNLSTRQFRAGDLVARIEAILSETGAPPQLLELEITESTLMHDERALVRDLEKMREIGTSIAVDDFGTGYSSFSYLRQLPVDALKIDRSFVTGIEESEADAALTAAIVSMGRALGLRIIAEGVETEGQRDMLASWGCDEMQGFLFSPAVPAEEMAEWLRS